MSASEETLQGFSDHFVINCCGAAAAALLVFDYVLTFEQEVNFIWSSTNYVYVLLFLANRLAMLGMTVGSVLNMLPWYSILSCTVVNWSLAGFQILTLLLWAIVSTLRVYAVSNRDWGFTILTLLLGLTPVATNIYANIEATFFPVPSYAYCYGQTEYTVVLANRLEITTRACLIASDALVLLIAWYQLHTSLYNVARVSVKSTLATYLLRDGTFYFLVLLVLNICQVITDFDRGVFYNPLPYFSNPITSIIISRFLLGIRRLALATHDSLPSYFSQSYETERQCAEQGRQRSGISTIAFNSNTVSHTASATTRHTVSLRHPPSEWSEYSRFTTSGAARYDNWGPDEIVELARVRYTQ
ncbi:uncharacterized protein C8Q71DRAFT_788942 [Rhodofomes roseus]|uniref:DUF6533 domain-containing protein n=1 Tax=Rhodofomes roseus TaxID=34475 RepID=A0ABQ8K0A7_9APHY|nr:uncharacterized protein C8Q71DRAFT_788942 [Rhodofomes roseus]KAH9829882.1 hypothetical protein C8Q71DRAFT_788942 [Rhodofomes roseus]